MEFDRVEVGRRIAKRRKELGIKQNALANKLGYHKIICLVLNTAESLQAWIYL